MLGALKIVLRTSVTLIIVIHIHYLGWTINRIAVRSSLSIIISVKAGIQIKSTPLGATNPLAMATALTDWLIAPAPIACNSAVPCSLNTFASAPATEFGFDFAETFNMSITDRKSV